MSDGEVMGLPAPNRTQASWPRLHTTPARVEGELVYAIGDVHGCYAALNDLLSRIIGDAIGRADGRHPILVFCGDYVDRGPDSAKVLAALDWIRRDGRFDLRLLKGNHDQGFLDFLRDPHRGGGWLRFGGDATLRSYGVTPPAEFDDPAETVRARDDLLERMPAAHLRILQGLKLMTIIGDYAFVHAGIRPGTKLAQQKPQDLLWIRDGFLDHTDRFEKRIVHGHSWTEAEPEIYDNRIGLDTGAYETGILTAIRIEDGEVEVLQSDAGAQTPSTDSSRSP